MNNDRLSSEQAVESFSMKNFLSLCLANWKWFVISIIFFGAVGVLYLIRKQPVYSRSEEILIKDQDSGGGVADVTNAFSSLGLFSSSPNVYNELIALTSPAVMYEVVDRLNLTMNYNLRDGLKSHTLYGKNLPYNVIFPGLPDSETVGFRIRILPNGKYHIWKVWKGTPDGKVKFDKEADGKVDGPAVMTPVGKVEVRTNDAFVPGTIPETDEMVIDVMKKSRQLTVENYVAKLKGDLTDQDAEVINLSIDDTSIERADDILTNVVLIYNERWASDNNKLSEATSKFITERLILIEKELGQVDNDIADQKSAMKLPDLEEAAKGYMAQDFKMSEEMLRTTNMLAMSTFLKEYLQDPKNAYSILPVNSGTENQVLEQQISAYNELLLQRNNLAENSSDENPLVKDLNKQLAGLRNAIVRSIDGHISNLQSILRNIDRAQGETQEKLESSPQQARKLLSVERQQMVMQELYLFLLQKREENELSQAFVAENTRIITPPYGKMKPVSPKKPLIIIIAFFLGVAVPAGSLYLSESSNTKIRSKKDIEKLPVPFAGEIPFIGKKRKFWNAFKTKKRKRKDIDKPKVVVQEGKRDIPNEAFRVVRSNIDFMLGRGEKTALALTSFNPGSGKSFVAYNLGASFALKGKKVLLIDGDLRHGSISTYVNSPHKGLSTYLTGHADDWQPLVVKVHDMPNLSVLPIGNRPPNPAELLDNGRLSELIEEAKTLYDIVLIDCPPVNIVVDTQIINQFVSRTIFVVRAGLLEKSALTDISNLIDDKKLKNITILLNGTKTEFSTYHTYGNYEAIDNHK